MAPSWSKMLFEKNAGSKNLLVVSSVAISLGAIIRAFTWNKRTPQGKIGYSSLKLPEEKQKNKVALDSNFIKQLTRIIKILITGPFSKETGYMLLIALSLISRSYCDVWMISMTTLIERTIISKDKIGFKENIGQFVTAMPLIAIVNQFLKYGISALKLNLRTRLTLKMQDHYLDGMTYYKVNNLDSRISNPDQLLTQDLERFCDSIVELYSNVTKPLLDIFLYVKTLVATAGYKTPLAMIGYLMISGVILTRLRRPVSRMTAEEQKLEGEFRYVNSRLITNCEEIAFYQGQGREKKTMRESFERVVSNLQDILNFKFSIGIVDDIIAKYLATVVGFASMAISFFSNKERHKQMQSFEIMEEYYATGRIVLRMAEALGRLSLAGRELTKLSGYTSRVILLMDVLDDVKQNRYVRTQVKSDNKDKNEDEVCGEKIKMDTAFEGLIFEQDHIIRFDKVPLVTPNGDVLIKEMSFEVVAGRNVLVCGPNGCGKSSLFRVLGELWPAYKGSVTKPHAGKLFYVPQRPYMTIGTLRDQIIYPDSIGHMKVKGVKDNDLKVMLDKVHLGYILEREGGWDSVQDWIDVLSGGEKQRIAMARLFYHAPQFAILDECTSAVSVDVEGYMYAHCKEVGITLFTVSHRKSLWKYHEYVLYMDGKGSYEYKPIDESNTEFGS
ncbi:ATP-binding cassette sub-family D member 3 isoform X1 [Hydra vulgaris]|uniref:ATP-binding cassette sub-family D member 3 n=1 Tax=Hydra vulgaris TaxID=6087 RepID=T2MGW6_HYDVU|nr:ATP-binding cassette sub-family D member 3 [Hydra vulgaris]